MGTFITPRGVVVEMSDRAAKAVGYKPTTTPSADPPKRPRGRPRKKPQEASESTTQDQD